MNMRVQTAETLVEYHILNLQEISVGATQENAVNIVERVVAEVGNVPVELRGKAPLFFVFPLFVRLKDVASEIIARESETASAVVLFTLLDPKKWTRPMNVDELPPNEDPFDKLRMIFSISK